MHYSKKKIPFLKTASVIEHFQNKVFSPHLLHVCTTFDALTAFPKFTGTQYINFKHYSLQSVFFYQKSLLLLPVLNYHSSTETPSKLSTQLLSGQLLEQKALITSKIRLFPQKHIFQKKCHLFKNSAGDRAPPKQSLLTLFITFVCITFDTLTALQ